MNKKLSTIHPGELLKEEIFDAYNLSITQAATLLCVTRTNLSNIVNKKSAISTEMALRINKVFGGSADFWLKKQMDWDLENAKKYFRINNLKPYRKLKIA